MGGEIKHLTCILLWVVSSLSYCCFISSRLPKGIIRFLSIIPVFFIFTILPLSLAYILTSITTTILISWLANFKLLLFSFDKGPLSKVEPKSLLFFISIASLPVVIKKKSDKPSHQSPKKMNSLKKLSLMLAMKVLLLAIFVGLWEEYKEHIHPKVMPLLFICLLYLMIDIIAYSTHVVVQALSGLELEPPSDKPYLSTSIQNFWGKRWNIAASNILRLTIYEPTRRASSCMGKNMATYVGYMATFLVSGLMHELIIYNITRQATTWEMTTFFLIHGTCVVVELILKRVLSDKYRLPTFLSRLLTIAFVLGTGSWLFLPPFSRHALDVRSIEEILCIFNFVMGKLKLI